ncbi:unnamed protein product [Discosporangium mesarthrocarpum]
MLTKAVADSFFYEPWENVASVDLKEARSVARRDGIEKAHLFLKARVCEVISRCSGRAMVVLHHAHLLQGEDVLILDPLLLLFDDHWSHMTCDGGNNVGGSGSLFFLLVDVDDKYARAMESTAHQSKYTEGKEKLLETWHYDGEKFNTQAFVGRMDGAFVLPYTLGSSSLCHEDLVALHQLWDFEGKRKRRTFTRAKRLALKLAAGSVLTVMSIFLVTAAIGRSWGEDKGHGVDYSCSKTGSSMDHNSPSPSRALSGGQVSGLGLGGQSRRRQNSTDRATDVGSVMDMRDSFRVRVNGDDLGDRDGFDENDPGLEVREDTGIHDIDEVDDDRMDRGDSPSPNPSPAADPNVDQEAHSEYDYEDQEHDQDGGELRDSLEDGGLEPTSGTSGSGGSGSGSRKIGRRDKGDKKRKSTPGREESALSDNPNPMGVRPSKLRQRRSTAQSRGVTTRSMSKN